MGTASRRAAQDLSEQHDNLSVRTSFNFAVNDERLKGPPASQRQTTTRLAPRQLCGVAHLGPAMVCLAADLSPARGERGQLFPTAHRQLGHQ